MDEPVRAVLDAARRVSVTALPDGSVDRRYRVLDPSGDTISRVDFAARLLDGAKTFLTEPVGTEPGGMAVNAAIQVDALGARTRLAGHLDDPVFDQLGFETVSMGAPATVDVYEFLANAVMLTDESRDIRSWRFHDLRAALGDQLEDWLGADAVICSNWSSIATMTAAFEDLATLSITGNWFVVDPGDVRIREPDDIVELGHSLGALDDSFDVVLNPSDDEVTAIADALEIDAPSVTVALQEIRDRAGITAAVVHTVPLAAVATRTETVRVPNYEARGPMRFTGGGDHFTGGLAVALAAGARWDVALELANACATHYVASGETATNQALRTFPDLFPGIRPSAPD